MKITKQKTWSLIQLIMVAYLIVSSCEEPDKYSINNEQQLAQNLPPVLKPLLKTTSFTNTFLIYNP